MQTNKAKGPKKKGYQQEGLQTNEEEVESNMTSGEGLCLNV